MRILPVLDLMAGAVVRGIGGRRHEYRPLRSQLCDGAAPRVVAQALQSQFGLHQFYLADLDAIAGRPPAAVVYRQLADAGLALWVDAGLRDFASLAAWPTAAQSSVSVFVAGLETLASAAALSELLDQVGPQRLAVSLDLQAGQPRAACDLWRRQPPLEIAADVIALGVRRLIVLDLADVGQGRGVQTLDLCRRLHADDPQLELIAGGGVRGLADLTALAEAGCSAALVASALHDGRLSATDLTAFAQPPPNAR